MSDRLFDELPRIQEWLADAPHWLLGLDFDGTLVPLADHPGQVHLSEQTRQLIQGLAIRPKLSIAIISGRDRADLQARVGIRNLIYAGNHGLDIEGPGFSYIDPTATACVPALTSLATTLAERLQPVPGAFVENKGLTLSVHYRQVSDAEHEEVRRIVHGVLASSDHPFVLVNGDKVYEIRPRTSWNKGTALVWIREQLGLPGAGLIYIGDDATDEDAFKEPAGITIRVGNVPDTAARYHVDSQSDVRTFLEWLRNHV
jgi:trehalose 6-phosphate phosphatase